MDNEIKCPKCKSKQITAQKKGFSVGKAAAGVVLTGGIGVVAGAIGSNTIMVTCLSCGNTWNPKKQAEEQQRQQVAKAYSDEESWKRKWYVEYQAGNYDAASEIYLMRKKFRQGYENIHVVYHKQVKKDKEDNLAIWLALGVIGILVIFIFYWIFS